jgi:hypothetical protein
MANPEETNADHLVPSTFAYLLSTTHSKDVRFPWVILYKHKATDIYGAVEVQLQEFLSWAVDPDGQLYKPVALCTEE